MYLTVIIIAKKEMRCQLIGLHFLEIFLHFCKVGSHFKQIAAGDVFRRNSYRDFSTLVLL